MARNRKGMRWFLLLLLLLLTACEPRTENASAEPAKSATGLDRSRAGTAAPDIEFEDPDGATTTLAGLRGKPVLLNLWATWCAPCVEELPTLDALAVREGERLQVVTLSQDMEGRQKVESFLAERKFRSLEGWLDAEMKMMNALGVQVLPTTILYDSGGKEVWRFTGDKDWSSSEAAAWVAEAQR